MASCVGRSGHNVHVNGVIMALTDDGNGVPKGPLAPLLIGILVAVIGASTGPLTGFAMNPARDFGPKIFTWLAGWGEIAMTGGRNIPYFIVPIIAPIIGHVLVRRFIAISLQRIYLSIVLHLKELANNEILWQL